MLVKIKDQYVNPSQVIRICKSHASQVVILLRDRDSIIVSNADLDDVAKLFEVKAERTLGDLSKEDED